MTVIIPGSAADHLVWTIRGYYAGAKQDAALPDEWDPEAPEAFEADEHDLAVLISDLPPRQREVLDLLYRQGLGPQHIAERLGIRRNAVDQATWPAAARRPTSWPTDRPLPARDAGAGGEPSPRSRPSTPGSLATRRSVELRARQGVRVDQVVDAIVGDLAWRKRCGRR